MIIGKPSNLQLVRPAVLIDIPFEPLPITTEEWLLYSYSRPGRLRQDFDFVIIKCSEIEGGLQKEIS